MRSVARTCFATVALVFLSACWGHGVVVNCSNGDYTCHQDTWLPIAVHPVPNVTRGAIDSVITIHLESNKRIAIFYGFNNPCQLSVTATTRQISDTLDVAFILDYRRIVDNPLDSVPNIRGCPAAIMNQVYQVTVNHSDYGVHVVRGFLNDSATLLATRRIASP